jgi:hypothetical protein
VTELGFRQATGALSNDNTNPFGNGLYAVAFTPQIFAFSANEFEVYHISLTGPAGSQLRVYVNSTFYDTTVRGDLNSWDPSNPLHMYGGQTLFFYWNAGTGSVPFVTVWCRTPGLI